MNNRSVKKLVVIFCGLAGIAWCLAILLLFDISSMRMLGWFALGFGFVSFPAAGAALYHAASVQIQGDVSSIAAPLHYSQCFIAVSIVVNVGFLLLAPYRLSTALFIVDMLLLFAYLGAMVASMRYLRAQKERVDAAARALAFTSSVSRALSESASLAVSADVKAALLKLKETVDYSAGSSARADISCEMEFGDLLSQISHAVIEGQSADTVLPLLDAAGAVWKRRNAARA